MKIFFGCIKLLHYYLQVGANFYAREFDRGGHQVVFFSDPLNPLHFLRDWFSEENRLRFSIWKSGGKKFGKQGIAFTPITLFPNYGVFPFSSSLAIRSSQKACFPNPLSFCEKMGIHEFDILWIDNIYYSFLLDLIPHKVSIYRISDDLRDFLRYGYGHFPIEKEICERADLVYGVTRQLVDHAQKFRPGKPTHLLPNAVELDHFSNLTLPEPDAFKSIPKPRAIYIGSINKLFNPQLLFDLAKNMPHVSFIAIGPKGHTVHFPNYSNLFYLGPIAYEQLAPYLLHSNVGLCLLDFNAKQPCTLQLKAYQYMACGIPYVSSSYDPRDFLEYEKPPGFYANSLQEMISCIEQSFRMNLENRNLLLKYAAANSWTTRYDKILGDIHSLNKI